MKILRKAFIKDYENTNNPKVRYRYGLVAGIFGIISNLLLFVAKIIIGLIGGSITIIADAINNLSDMGSSVVVVFGFKLSAKPADSEHPFGHARYEQIMALIISLIVMLIGVLLAKESVTKLLSNEATSVSVATYIVLGSAIVVKLFQMMLYKDFAKAINSDVLKASSVDSRNDVISTTSVLIAMVIIQLVGNVGFSIDGVFGIIVSLFIIISSIKLLKETINPLLGEAPNREFVDNIKNKILSYENVLGIHDFVIHTYGAHNYFANAHVEVCSKMDFMLAHDMIDNIEREVMDLFNVALSIHLDPIETDNAEVNSHKERVIKTIKQLDNKLSIHDFRMVFGETHTNILFDIVIPFGDDTSIETIKDNLNLEYINEKKKYYFVINVDRE